MGREDPLEKEVATHSGILAWEIPRTEELGGLQSMGSQELDTAEPPPPPCDTAVKSAFKKGRSRMQMMREKIQTMFPEKA